MNLLKRHIVTIRVQSNDGDNNLTLNLTFTDATQNLDK